MQQENPGPQPPPMPQGYGQAPPPQYPLPPRPSGKIPTWVWIVLGVGCGGGMLAVIVLAAILFPVFATARNSARKTSCASNMRVVSLGIAMYTQDYDEIQPKADVWVDQTMPYTKQDRYFHCPVVSVQNPTLYGYAYNENISEAKSATINEPYATCMLFETSKGEKNANDALTSIVTPYRHNGSNNFGFADGHVKSFRESDPIPRATR